MSRYNPHLDNVGKIYEIACKFWEYCLTKDGSLFFPNEKLWTLERLANFKRVFIESPDEGDRKFMEKFKDQLKKANDKAIYRLAAEMIYVHFLFSSNIKKETKLKIINEILIDGDNKPIAINNEFIVNYYDGLGSTGQNYNTRRFEELSFWINFVIAFKEHPNQKTLENPETFSKFIDTIEGAATRQSKHIILHLMFPDCFERISSGNHKRQIQYVFGDLIEDSNHENIDKQIYEIRGKLQKFLGYKDIDFYNPPLSAAWGQGVQEDDNGEEDISLDLVHYKKQIIYYGPPGTGKTYRAKQMAMRIIRSEALKKWGVAEYFKKQAILDSVMKQNIHRLQLHPGYGYEEFIQGLHVSSGGATEYRPGFLLRLLQNMKSDAEPSSLPHVLILDEINRTDLSRMLGECFSLFENRNETVSLPASCSGDEKYEITIPDNLYIIGTMNLIDQSVEHLDFALRRRFLWCQCPFNKQTLLRVASERWNETSSDVRRPWEDIESDFKMFADAAENLNRGIIESPVLGEQYQIGHVYFFDIIPLLLSFISGKPRIKNFLWDTKKRALPPLDDFWNMALFPLLEQYLAGVDGNAKKDELATLKKTFFTQVSQ